MNIIPELVYVIIIYFTVINVTGFVLTVSDKKKAKAGKWRVPEKTLFIVSILGASVSVYLAMRLFRHKTKHKRFMIGIPVIIALQLALIIILCLKSGLFALI
ncbi:MAG: DUF1294 domain-containing protein [Oscillospiraceae bacterium]|nr:DUF1294 domain-containing protein [Oscillospiraceae bacterium]